MFRKTTGIGQTRVRKRGLQTMATVSKYRKSYQDVGTGSRTIIAF